MKFKFRYFIPVCTLLSALLSGACSDNDKEIEDLPDPPYLTVTETRFTDVSVDDVTLYTTVDCNRTVKVESSDEWCDAELLADTEKNNLRLTVLANPDEKERTATVTVSAPECEPAKITVTQAARSPEPFLTVSATEFPEVDGAGEKLTATVTTNQPGVQVESGEKWCEVSYNPTVTKNNLTLTVLPNTGVSRTATVTVSVAACEPKQIVVTQLKKLSADCELLTFSVSRSKNPALKSDLTFDFNKSARTLKAMYLKWIDGANPEMMVPTFTFKGEKVLVKGEPVVSGETKISLADDVELEIVAENGDKKVYTVTLNCPQINTELPVLRMQPDYEITSKENYVDTSIKLYSPHTTEGWWDSATDGKIQMRGRGNSTWGLPKKPYRMKFSSKFSPIGLTHAKEKSWVLLANDMDKSLLRDHLGFAISRDLYNKADGYHDASAVLFTPCSQHINVYKNDDYLGLYQMSDQMERAKGRIEVDKLEEADGDDAEKITGGHIMETDIHEGTFYTSHRIKMSHKYPKDDDCTPAQYKYIENFVNTAEGVLYGSNFKDPVNGWRKYFDEKTLADFIIVKELCGDMDGYTSTYFYKRRGVDKLFFGPIWDVDKGWDNERRVPHTNPLSSLMIYAGFYMPDYINPDWFHRFWQDETFRAFVAKRWADKRAQLLASVSKELDEMPVKMAKAIEANFTVWEFYYQYSDEAKMPARTYPLEIERIRTLTQQRATLLDKLFNE